MHVVVLSNALFRTDGIANSALGIAEGLVAAGHELSLVHPIRSYEQPRLVDWHALGARVVGVAELSVRSSDALATSQGFAKALQTIRSLKPDVIHTHQPAHGFIAGLAALARPTKVAVHVRGAAPEEPGIAQRLGLRMADVVIPVSKATGQSWEPHGASPAKTSVIYNGIDLERFSPPSSSARGAAKESLGIPSSAPVVGFVGRFTEAKGIFVLAEAYQRLAAQRHELWFVAVGGTPAQAEQRRMLESTLAEFPNVRLLDAVADTRPIMNAFDVGVVPSNSEAFSRVVLELLATGIPVCGSAVGGTPEALGPDAGRLTSFGDVDALAASISGVLENESPQELRDSARERAELFGLDECISKNVELLSNLPIGT